MPQRPEPPTPIEPDNPIWIGRAWQWTFDRIIHQDTCTDETKDLVEKAIAMIQDTTTVLTTGLEAARLLAADGDATLTEVFKKHRDFHDHMDIEAKARAGVWKMQGDLAKKLLRFGTEGVGLTIIAIILRYIGVL